ncbi:MAG TPA: PAS domain S-box protein [Candidatus Acidoferrales bacterium]|nr:PAS domain S-box protein [Candidatus Acidoferrales bacterium]
MRDRPATLPQTQPAETPFTYIVILCISLVLLAAVLSPRLYGSSLSSVLFALVLLFLGAALALVGRSLLLACREQRDTAKALDNAERTYKSVFDSALDSILVFDDAGTCLNANPAALILLGCESDALTGRPMEGFFCHYQNPGMTWRKFLNHRSGHAETMIVRADGHARFVEYTMKLNFLPGRHVAIVRDVTRKKEAQAALRESEERFEQMADNIQEIFWMIDVKTAQVLYLSPAYETITGRARRSFVVDPRSQMEAIHPDDRVRILSRLNDCVKGGRLEEEFRIIRIDNAIRWLWARAFPVADSFGTIRRLVGTVQDVTERKSAEEQIARNYDLAESARAEAEAFRVTSLALTQNLSMDAVLDTLLQALLKLIPCTSARVILVEADSRLFLAREVVSCKSNDRTDCSPETFDAHHSRFLMHVLTSSDSLLISDTAEEPDWDCFDGFSHLRSWLCVPLIASKQLLGLLSLGDTNPHAFTREDLRLAKSLSIPAAVAIQNARLYEQAEILRLELEQRLLDLERAERALGHVQGPLT